MAHRFLADDDGEITQQRYRITQVIADGTTRRAAFRQLAASARAAGGASGAAALLRAARPEKPHSASLNPRKLTKLDADRLAKVPARQRNTLVRPQVVQGVTYDGPGFAASPATVEFLDFDVGETYTAVVTLTNVSRSINAFKVLPMPAEVADCLAFSYQPQSQMSAGLSAKVTVVFTPREDVDIDAALSVLAQTGPVEVPVVCRTRKRILEVSTRRVDFGRVVAAETATRELVITNAGALPTTLEVGGDIEALLMPGAGGEPSLSMRPPLAAVERVTIAPGGRLPITLSFTPLRADEALDTSIFISVDDDSVPDIPVIVSGAAADVPVFVCRNSTLDFRVVDEHTLFRDKFAVRNTTPAAVHIQPTVPRELRGMIDFVPKHGFAQPGREPVEFQVKFRPSYATLMANRAAAAGNQASRFADATANVSGFLPAQDAPSEGDIPRAIPSATPDGDTTATPLDIADNSTAAPAEEHRAMTTSPRLPETPAPVAGVGIDVPIRVDVVGQAMPLTVRLHAVLSPRSLIIDPPELFVGTLVPGEAVSVPFILANNSLLTRAVACLQPPPNVVLHPPCSCLRLTPGESLRVTAEVRPPEGAPVGEFFRQQLTWLCEDRERLKWTVSGKVRAPRLRFDTPNVVLPRVAVGDSTAATVVLRNVGQASQRFSFGPLMQRYGITVLPASGEILRGEAVQVVVGFSAHPGVVDPPRLDDPPPPSFTPTDDLAEAEAAEKAKKGMPPKKPKKKTKAEEEAERRATELAEARARDAEEERAAARRQVREELAALIPWESSEAGGEEWSKHRTVAIPCFVEDWDGAAVFLTVRAVVVRPVVTAVVAGAPVVADVPDLRGTGPALPVGLPLVFGDVPALAQATQSVVLRNIDPERTARLVVRPLDSYGPFTVVRPPTDLLPGQSAEVSICFFPKLAADYSQAIVISDGYHCTTIRARGRGLPTALTVSMTRPVPEAAAAAVPEKKGKRPSPAPTPIADLAASDAAPEEYVSPDGRPTLDVEMPHCLAGDAVESPIFFHNQSRFALTVTVTIDPDSATPTNPDGQPPFFITPHVFSLAAGGRMEGVVSFFPGGDGLFSATATVEFGGEAARKTLRLSGFGAVRAAFLQMPGAEAPAPLDSALPTEFRALLRDPFEVPGVALEPPLLLTFETDAGAPLPVPEAAAATPTKSKDPKGVPPPDGPPVAPPVTRRLHVGICKGCGSGEATVEGISEADARAGWKVDTARVALQAGTKAPVMVTFAPTQALMSTLPLPGIDVVSTAELRVVVRGGVPAADRVYRIRLKGTVRAV